MCNLKFSFLFEIFSEATLVRFIIIDEFWESRIIVI
jgi:hypothetical protein